MVVLLDVRSNKAMVFSIVFVGLWDLNCDMEIAFEFLCKSSMRLEVFEDDWGGCFSSSLALRLSWVEILAEFRVSKEEVLPLEESSPNFEVFC